MLSPIPKPPTLLSNLVYLSNKFSRFSLVIPFPLSWILKPSSDRTTIIKPEILLYFIAFDKRLSISFEIFLISQKIKFW